MERPTSEELHLIRNWCAYLDEHNIISPSNQQQAKLLAEIDALQAENTTLQQQLREVKESKDATIHSWRTEADRLANENGRLKVEAEQHGKSIYNAAKNYADMKQNAESLEGRIAMVESRLKAATEALQNISAQATDQGEHSSRIIANQALRALKDAR